MKTKYHVLFLKLVVLCFVLVIGSAFIFSTNAEGQTTSNIPAQAVIHNQPPAFLMLSRIDGKTPQYEFVGTLVMCDTLFDIKAITIYSPSDSTRLRTTYISRSIQFAQECNIESFRFGIHGGALRRQIEKTGNCVIMIHGANYVLTFSLTEYGENLLLNIIVELKECI